MGKTIHVTPFMFVDLQERQHRGREGVEGEACRVVLDAWEVLVALHLGSSMLGQGLPRKVGQSPYYLCLVQNSFYQVHE